MRNHFFILFFLGLPQVSLATQQCIAEVDQYFAQFYDISQLQTNCHQKGGHMEISSEEQAKSCESLKSIEASYEMAYNNCSAMMEAKAICEKASGHKWFKSTGLDSAPWDGYCSPQCPEGLLLLPAGGMCQCPEGSEKSYIFPGENKKLCYKQSEREACDKYIDQFTGEIAPNAPPECRENPDEIAAQRQRNIDTAGAEALELAKQNWQNQIQQKIQEAQQVCNQKTQSFMSSCQSLDSLQQNFSSGGGGTKEHCDSLKNTVESAKQSLASKFQQCSAQAQSVQLACPESVSATGKSCESAPCGSITEGVNKYGEGVAAEIPIKLHQESTPVPGVSANKNSINAQLSLLQSSRDNFISQADNSINQCFAAVGEAPPPDTTSAAATETKSDWGGAASLASTIASNFSDDSELGGGGQGGNVAGGFANGSAAAVSGG